MNCYLFDMNLKMIYYRFKQCKEKIKQNKHKINLLIQKNSKRLSMEEIGIIVPLNSATSSK